MKNGLYELVVAPEDWKGKKYRGRYCYEHHLIYWQNTNHVLSEGECIHHKNGNTRDNRFENLELKTSKAHIREHNNLGNKPKSVIEKLCPSCKKVFYRDSAYIRYRIKIGQNSFYCSKKCAGIRSPIG